MILPGIWKYVALLGLVGVVWGHGNVKGRQAEQIKQFEAILEQQAVIDRLQQTWRQRRMLIDVQTAADEQALVAALEDAHERNLRLETELTASAQILPAPDVGLSDPCPVCVAVNWDEFSRLHNFAKGLIDRSGAGPADNARGQHE